MTVSALVCTHGSEEWRQLALSRPVPSCEAQGFDEVVVVHLPNGTVAEARNEAASRALGEWIVFVDGDDELDAGFLAAIKRGIERGPGDDLLLSPSVSYTRNGRPKPPMMWPRQNIENGNWMVIGTTLRRSTFLSVGGFREYGWSEDWDLWARCEMQGAIPVEVKDAIYIAHVNQNSRNRSQSRPAVLYWHQRIGHDNWPHIYDSPTPQEDARKRLMTAHVRRR